MPFTSAPGTFSGVTSEWLISHTTFSGNIVNQGVISAGGIVVSSSTFTSGSLIDTGTVIGGIRIDSSSKILASGATAAIFVNGPQTFGGGITNAGTLSAGQDGVHVLAVTTFSGGITNSGQLTAAAGHGIVISSVDVFAGAVGGSIANRGTISAGADGIFVGGHATGAFSIHSATVNSFVGGIRNSGKISAASQGILVGGNVSVFGIGGFTVANFTGGISNAGTIAASFNGIIVGGNVQVAAGIGFLTIETFSGGINNAGLISAGSNGNGILVGGTVHGGSLEISTFSGGVSNSGTISAGRAGIFVGGSASGGTLDIDALAGSVINSGKIFASAGIVVGGPGGVEITSFAGGITNRGQIAALASGIAVAGAAIAGNIVNTGTISGQNGINLLSGFISGAIIDSGTIVAGQHGILADSNVTHGINVASGGKVIATGFSAVGIKVGAATFTGGVTNAGSISAPSGFGVHISAAQTFAGGVTNKGAISAERGIAVSNANRFGTSSSGGGLVNSGTIAASFTGIFINRVTSFFGGITNSGTISADAAGIEINDSNVSGRLLDNGAILGTDYGIHIVNGSMSGGIAVGAHGRIAGGSTGIAISGTTLFLGGIVNSGAVSATGYGIAVDFGNVFSGGVSNSGTVFAAAWDAIVVNGYAQNNAGTGGTLTLTDGRHAASIALLGNYMAGSFVTTPDGHGGTLLTAAEQTQPPLLARPRG